MLKKPKICFFGTFVKNHVRTQVLMKGLLKLKKVSIIEISFPFPHFLKTNILKFAFLVIRNSIKSIITLLKSEIDIIFIPYPAIGGIFLAKIVKKISKVLNRKISKVPIIFDPFISLFESYSQDYNQFRTNSILGKFYYFLEYKAFKYPNLIISDTNQHKQLYMQLFGPKAPIERIFIGTDDEFIRKYQRSSNKIDDSESIDKKFIVGFIGNYIPLQGIEYIVRSAKYLGKHAKNIEYEIVGGTIEDQKPYKEICYENNIKNIKFIPRIPFKDVPIYLDRSDIQLGIFGHSKKSMRVIPNKVYVAIAAQKTVITAETLGINELFTNQTNIVTCEIANPESLAKAIISLYENPGLNEQIAKRGKLLFQQECSPIQLGKNFLRLIEKYNFIGDK